MKIYISGQITGLSEEEYKQNFENAEFDVYRLYRNITGKYHNPAINPLDLNPFLGIKNWWCYMITDLYHLRQCTHIAMQKNWINSRGAVIEYFFAKFIYKLKIVWL